MASKLQIIKRAVSQTLGITINAVEDNADVAQLVDEHYDSIVEASLTQQGWKFGRRVSALTKLTAEPERPWAGLWASPPGMLSLHYVQDACGIRLDHEERDLVSTKAIAILQPAPAAYAVHTFRVAEDRWPPDFTQVVQLRMEAVCLRSVEQYDKATERDRRADGLEMRARARDGRASTATDPSEWDLAAARNRSGAWTRGR